MGTSPARRGVHPGGYGRGDFPVVDSQSSATGEKQRLWGSHGYDFEAIQAFLECKFISI